VFEQRGALRVRDRSSLGAAVFAGRGGPAYPATGVSPDGRVVLGPAGDERLGLFDVATGQLLARSEARGRFVGAAGFGPSGEVIAPGGSAALLLDARTGETLRRFEHPGKVAACAISPDGRSVAIAGGDLVQHVDREGARAWTRPCRDVRAVAFSPDGKEVLAGGEALLLLERGTGSVVRSVLREGETVVCACFTPDGREILAALREERTLRLYEVATGDCVRTFLGNTMPLISCACSRDGRLVASTSMERAVRLWDRGSGRLIRTVDPGTSSFGYTSCAFSAGGETLFAVETYGRLRAWDLGRPFPLDVVFPGLARDPEGSARRAFDAIDLHERPWEPTPEELPILVPPEGPRRP
jgi:WD40 repeat protein